MENENDGPALENGDAENGTQLPRDTRDGVPLNTEGIQPRKRGRPKGSKTRKDSAADKPVAPVDGTFFIETCLSVFELGDSALCNILVARITRYDKAKAVEFAEVLKANRLTEKDKEYLRRNLNALVSKYPILALVGPEIALLVFGAQYALRMKQLFALVEVAKPIPKEIKE